MRSSSSAIFSASCRLVASIFRNRTNARTSSTLISMALSEFNTVAAITAEKAGIMKPGVPYVTACTGDALLVLKARSHEVRAPMSVVSTMRSTMKSGVAAQSRFAVGPGVRTKKLSP